jgi:hypothetical protein
LLQVFKVLPGGGLRPLRPGFCSPSRVTCPDGFVPLDLEGERVEEALARFRFRYQNILYEELSCEIQYSKNYWKLRSPKLSYIFAWSSCSRPRSPHYMICPAAVNSHTATKATPTWTNSRSIEFLVSSFLPIYFSLLTIPRRVLISFDCTQGP